MTVWLDWRSVILVLSSMFSNNSMWIHIYVIKNISLVLHAYLAYCIYIILAYISRSILGGVDLSDNCIYYLHTFFITRQPLFRSAERISTLLSYFLSSWWVICLSLSLCALKLQKALTKVFVKCIISLSKLCLTLRRPDKKNILRLGRWTNGHWTNSH